MIVTKLHFELKQYFIVDIQVSVRASTVLVGIARESYLLDASSTMASEASSRASLNTIAFSKENSFCFFPLTK
ncbi:hypothetical protein Pelo_6262 [Pelomyxa schiedti]|nr:hypothetical protein Pelo_6262 [Pelomyxa schiedti]